MTMVRRNYIWIILSGITLISVIILAELIATIIYLRSPERVVAVAFQKLIDTKSYSFSVNADEAKGGLVASLSGDIDQKSPTRPVASADFSFIMDGRYSLKGKIAAADGKAFVQFENTGGLPVGLASALGKAWTGVDVSSLIFLAEENALSFSSRLNDADINVILAALKKNIPFRVAGKENDEMLGNVYVVRYPIAFDKISAVNFINDLHILFEGQKISEDKY